MSQQETTELVERKALKRLGRYAIAEELAKGGMAQLYVARKDGARELCVLKRLLFEFETDEVARARFQREARVASYLTHPNIVRTLDAGFESGTFCISSELVAGNTLESVIERLRSLGRSLPPEVAVSIALKVLDALAHAHELRAEDGSPLDIVHRDISPRNILIDFSGEVKIIDFGVARIKLDQFRTAPGVIVGSLEYMSPEQAAALPIDRRSDIYSIAVVTYEMLTGRHLVPRHGQLTESLTAIVREIPPPISSISPHLPKAFDAVLGKALAKNANDRYSTARELHNHLAEASVGIVLAPSQIVGMLLRGIMPDAESKMLAMIERCKRALEISEHVERAVERTAPVENNARYEPTALVDRPRAGRARQISITAADEPPMVGTKLGAMVMDMPGESVPLSRTAFESLRRSNKKLFFSLIGLSAVAVLLLVAAGVAFLSRTPEAPPPVVTAVTATAAREETSENAAPGVVSRAAPEVQQQRREDIGEQVDQVIAERGERAPVPVPARAKKTKAIETTKIGEAPVEPAADRVVAPAQPVQAQQEPAQIAAKETRAPYPDLRRQLALLRSSNSKDSNTYYRLLGGIETAMSALPTAAQKRIQSELNAAQLTYDVDALGRALEQLMKANADAS